MDTLTHTLVGALVGRALPMAKARVDAAPRTLVGAVSGAFPDIDYLAFWFDPLSFLSDWHRGPTHSLLLLPIWAVLLAGLCAWLLRRPAALWPFTVIAALALVFHILTDLATVYGTGVLVPLSDWRPGLGSTFVIDPWLTLPLLLVFMLALQRGGSRLPIAGLVLLIGTLGAHLLLQRAAVEIGRDYAAANGLPAERVRAIAQPLSPLHWKIVVADAAAYHIAHVRLSDSVALPTPVAAWFGLDALLRAYRTADDADWRRYALFGTSADDAQVGAAWRHPLLERFRRFAHWPALYRIDRHGEGLCIWFTDRRFALPALEPAFRFGLCRDGSEAEWRLYRLRLFSRDDSEPV